MTPKNKKNVQQRRFCSTKNTKKTLKNFKYFSTEQNRKNNISTSLLLMNEKK